MFAVIAVIGSLVVSALGAPAASGPGPTGVPSLAPPGPVTVEVVTVNGSGCRPGSVVVAAMPDHTGFTVTYRDYVAKVGVGAEPVDFRKNCQLTLAVQVPQGFSYAIARARYRGFVSLAAGATGLERANYYFQGSSADTFVDHSFRGPLQRNWQATDVTESTELVFAPCGRTRNLNVNTELRVAAGTSDPGATTSLMTMRSTRGSIRTLYQFAWRTC